jgi:stage III sporulation protein AF
MLGYAYTWLQNLSGFLVLSVVVMHLIPGKNYEKYVRFYIGLVLITLVLEPILQLKQTELPDVGHTVTEFEQRLEQLEIEYEQK